jgi:molybdate transport system regulatory protein
MTLTQESQASAKFSPFHQPKSLLANWEALILPTYLKKNAMLRKPEIITVKRISPRLRVLYGDEVALGPGKADLLAMVAETGSIREAADRMGMSYMRAWKLIKTMNACFKNPLVEAIRGGREHGGASLTKAGRRALQLYQQLTKDCLKVTTARWKELRALLRN